MNAVPVADINYDYYDDGLNLDYDEYDRYPDQFYDEIDLGYVTGDDYSEDLLDHIYYPHNHVVRDFDY